MLEKYLNLFIKLTANNQSKTTGNRLSNIQYVYGVN